MKYRQIYHLFNTSSEQFIVFELDNNTEVESGSLQKCPPLIFTAAVNLRAGGLQSSTNFYSSSSFNMQRTTFLIYITTVARTIEMIINSQLRKIVHNLIKKFSIMFLKTFSHIHTKLGLEFLYIKTYSKLLVISCLPLPSPFCELSSFFLFHIKIYSSVHRCLCLLVLCEFFYIS